MEGGGPAGGLPPHEWKLYFKEGGVGTLLPVQPQSSRNPCSCSRQSLFHDMLAAGTVL